MKIELSGVEDDIDMANEWDRFTYKKTLVELALAVLVVLHAALRLQIDLRQTYTNHLAQRDPEASTISSNRRV